jgi:hypothetical protein
MLARQQARAAAVGADGGGAGDGNGFTDEEMAAIMEDDAELARDIEEHAGRPGMLALLRQFLGGGEQPPEAYAAAYANAEEDEQEDADGGGVPGAWPEDQEQGGGARGA